MKFTKLFILAGLMAATACGAAVIIPAYTSFSTGGASYVSAGTNFAVISDNSFNGAAPVVTYAAWSCDKVGAVAQFYSISNQTPCISTNFPGPTCTTNYVNSTNGLEAGKVMIMQHIVSDTYEPMIISSVTLTNQVVMVAAPLAPTLPGDMLYECYPNGSIPVGAGTNSLTGTGIYTGQPSKPLLLMLQGTAIGQINALSATFR